MTPAQLQRFQAALQALLDELSEKAPAVIEPNRTDVARVGGDEDTQALNEMHQVIASNRNRQAAGLSARILKALGKIRETPEEFGLCETCEEPLPTKRLEALPYAELCVPCQSEKDGPRGPIKRKHLTDFA
ncbi:MAG TPA: TraR/DksA family transcriptional regulator [Myxococcaceae bacterium]|nr:TraR/DksA family transcriptional regulator [Myxococcaceae bacterium]